MSAWKYPSRNAGRIVAEVKEEFRRDASLTEPAAIAAATKEAEDGLSQLLMFQTGEGGNMDQSSIELEVGNLGRAEENLRTALSLGERLDVDVEHAYLLLARSLFGRDDRDGVAEVAAQYAVRHPVGAYREQIEALRAEDG